MRSHRCQSVAFVYLQTPMPTYLQRLTHRFRQQQAFAATYSKLYACFFGTVADWLETEPAPPVVAWLLQASEGRQPFDITLLLAASLHREVLLGEPTVADLAAYYPTASGTRACDDGSYASALQQAIWARRDALFPFIQQATVQTNETGRGICWLVPLHFVPWPEVHLVDLGASAGLNLVAEQRAFRFQVGDEAIELGKGKPPQFVSRVRGNGRFLAQRQPIPKIVGRTGGDIAPFKLETAVSEQTLAAYVWADQVHRLHRLREGIAAYHKTKQSEAPVQVHPLDLPSGLESFLQQHLAQVEVPIVLYNTYITMYLPERGWQLRQHLAHWAQTQKQPVLWLQWEPQHGEPSAAPELGWLAWTADYWHEGTHQQWLLGWTHPHGTQLQWELDLAVWGNQLSELG